MIRNFKTKNALTKITLIFYKILCYTDTIDVSRFYQSKAIKSNEP